MDTETSRGSGRYAAFLSYSHRDAAAARTLHRRLEAYRIPRRLVGSEGERGPVPARLVPIFRDREELPAAGDLSEKVRAALADSSALVILCSPAAAASPWVGKEIDTFRALHPGRPIIAAILDGEPAEAFPPALTAAGAEPLAADLRPGRDGKRLGLLKLVAGLSGVGVDALVQRDAQRRLRRVTAVTGVALAAVVAMAVLTAVALQARAEAQRQRAEAEGLVEFMLTDLRDRLKGVGRLDVLTAVNRRALGHYRKQDLASLPADALDRRARTLLAMGEDDEKLDHAGRARGAFEEAERTTAAVLADSPSDPERIFNHAQSEYWVGYMAYLRKDWPTAERHWQSYDTLALRLVQAQPAKPRSYRELGYSRGNLCTLALDSQAPAAPTLRTCLASLAAAQKVSQMIPGDDGALSALANRYAWAGKAWLGTGDIARAETSFGAYLHILEGLVAKSPTNADLQDQLMRALMTTAEYLTEHGHAREGAPYAARAQTMANRLTRLDPSNSRWRKWEARIGRLNRIIEQE